MSDVAEAVPTDAQHQLDSSWWEGVRALGRLLAPHRWQVVALVVVGLLVSVLETIGVSLLFPLLEALSPSQTGAATGAGSALLETSHRIFSGIPPSHRLQITLLVLLAVIVVKNLVSYGFGAWTAALQFRVERDLNLAVFDQLTRVGFLWFAKRSTGDLLTQMTTEPERTSLAARDGLQVVVLCSLIAGYGTFLLLLSWPMTLLAAFTLGLMSLVLRLPGYAAIHAGSEVTRLSPQLSQVRIETLQGMRLVRAYERAADERERFKRLLDRVVALRTRAAALSILPGPVAEVAGTALLIGLISLATHVVTAQRGVMVPLLLTFFFVLYRLLPRVAQLHTLWVNLAFHLAGVCAVRRMLERSDKPYVVSGSRACPELREGIELQHVWFTYDAAEGPVLQDLNLAIPKGQITAVVGVSGAGKSTLVDLLLRFHDPDAGAVRVDGVNLRDLDLQQWRRAIGIVSQDIVVFQASIRDNIAYSKPSASQDEIIRAARQARADGFIASMAQGYDTMVGDRGVRLSAGQRQRVAIARALLRDPQVLILDEATSALDSESEWHIQQVLEGLRGTRTVLVISHRLSSSARADHIVVLKDGRAVERGTHADLLSKGGAYAAVWALQAGEHAEAAVR